MQFCNTKYVYPLGCFYRPFYSFPRRLSKYELPLHNRPMRLQRVYAATIDCTGLVPPSHLSRNDYTSWSSEACLLYSVKGTLSVQSVAKVQYILEVLLFIHIYVILPTYTQSLGKEDEGSPSHACMISNIGIALIHSTTTQCMTKPTYSYIAHD